MTIICFVSRWFIRILHVRQRPFVWDLRHGVCVEWRKGATSITATQSLTETSARFEQETTGYTRIWWRKYGVERNWCCVLGEWFTWRSRKSIVAQSLATDGHTTHVGHSCYCHSKSAPQHVTPTCMIHMWQNTLCTVSLSLSRKLNKKQSNVGASFKYLKIWCTTIPNNFTFRITCF